MNPFTTIQSGMQAAARDPKKTGILAVLLLVMGVMWFRYLGHEPAPAGAAVIDPAVNAPADNGNAAGRPVSDNDHRAGGKKGSWARTRMEPVARNLFEIDYEQFPLVGKPTGSTPPADAGSQNVEPAKSGPTPADLKKERLSLVSSIRDQALQLKLQSTVTSGATLRAVINGQLVSAGDTVDNFRVTRITPRGVVIEREGIRFELQMKK